MAKNAKKRSSGLSQTLINRLNLTVAVLALLISVPGSLYQLYQWKRDARTNRLTQVAYYAVPSNVDIKSRKVEEADCSESAVSHRRDAFRCFSGHSVLDPCFEIEQYADWSKVYAYCPVSDTQSQADRLLSTSSEKIYSLDSRKIKQDTTSAGNNSSAWLIELEDGAKCRKSSGAVSLAYGVEPLNFGCNVDANMMVTGNLTVIDSKYFTTCKSLNESLYKTCYISKVVY